MSSRCNNIYTKSEDEDIVEMGSDASKLAASRHGFAVLFGDEGGRDCSLARRQWWGFDGCGKEWRSPLVV